MDEAPEFRIVCQACALPKPPQEFPANNKCRYGRSHTCCDCRSEKRRSEESKHKSQGLCFCGKPRAKDSVQCRQHKDMNTWYYRLSVSDPARVEALKVAAKARYRALKLAAYNAYGGPVCACCSEARLEFLSIDHIGGRGDVASNAPHRKGDGLYRWLRQNGYPVGFRVLCMNCNFSIGHSGYCPHERERQELPVSPQP